MLPVAQVLECRDSKLVLCLSEATAYVFDRSAERWRADLDRNSSPLDKASLRPATLLMPSATHHGWYVEALTDDLPRRDALALLCSPACIPVGAGGVYLWRSLPAGSLYWVGITPDGDACCAPLKVVSTAYESVFRGMATSPLGLDTPPRPRHC